MDNNIIGKKMLELSSNLEGTLKNYLKCYFNDFGIKSELLLDQDWAKPINFVLGVKYAYATDKRKHEIKDFLENELIGVNIKNLVESREFYCLGDKNKTLEYISQTVKKIQYLLSDEIQ